MIGVFVGSVVARGTEDSELISNRVLVLPLRSERSDSQSRTVARLSADVITDGLQRSGVVEVIDAYTAFGLHGETDSLPAATGNDSVNRMRTIASRVKAGKLVWGSIRPVDSLFDVRIVITDAADGRVLRVLDPILMKPSQLRDGLSEIQARTVGAVASAVDQRINSLVSSSSPPPSFEAYHEFVNGLDRFREGRWSAASQHFVRAASLDTAFVLASLWEVQALQNNAQFAAAESLVAALLPKRAALPPAERFGLDMFAAEHRKDFVAAYYAARHAAELAPQSNWRFMAGYNAYRIGRPHDALDELLELDPTAGWTRDWRGYWALRALTLHQLGEYESELQITMEGLKRVPRLSMPPMAILYGGFRALAALGRIKALDSLYEEVLTRVQTTGAGNLSALTSRIGNELRAHNLEDAAQRYYQRCLSVWNDEDCHYGLGHYDTVARRFATDSASSSMHALVLARRKQRADAERAFARAARQSTAVGTWSYGLAFERARLAQLLGDRRDAEELIRSEPQRGRMWELLHEQQGQDFPHGDPLLRELIQTSRRNPR
jgi:hypothetical protein